MDLNVHAVTLCVMENLKGGEHARLWQADPAKRSALDTARQALGKSGVAFGSLRDGKVPERALEAALVVDYDGVEFDLWFDYLWDEPRWADEYFWLTGDDWESYSGMTISESGLIRPSRIYYDVTELDREAADELVIWLEGKRRELFFNFDQMRNAGLYPKPPERKRGRPPGVKIDVPQSREAMPGFTWLQLAHLSKDSKQRRHLKQQYVRYWEDQQSGGRKPRVTDPANNFDKQIRRYLKRFRA